MVLATVREWRSDEGWGVLESSETPGGCWVHFSHIESAPVHRAGDAQVFAFKTLLVGETVDLEWESPGQDGFAYRAVVARRLTGPGRSRAHPE